MHFYIKKNNELSVLMEKCKTEEYEAATDWGETYEEEGRS